MTEMAPTRNPSIRRRNLAQRSLSLSLILQSLSTSTYAFNNMYTNPFQQRIPRQITHKPIISQNKISQLTKSIHSSLYMQKRQKPTTTSISKSSPTSRRTLTRGQEHHLLRRAAEYRRITKIKTTLMTQRKSEPLLTQWAAACGYPTTLEGIESFESALSLGQKARDELITSHMGYVHHVVKTISQTKRILSLSSDDLVQEGVIGLTRAVDKFDISRTDVRFATYAVYWIRAAVLRGIAERDDLVRVPEHVTNAISKMKRAAMRLGLVESGMTGVTWREVRDAKKLAEESGLTEKELDVAMSVDGRRQCGVLEYEAWMSRKDVDVGITAGDEGNHWEDVLSPFLKPKEMEALSLRYGLSQKSKQSVQRTEEGARDYLAEAEEDLFGANGILTTTSTTSSKGARVSTPIQQGRWGEAMSFKEVGKQMAISAEYGRRLCTAALEKLRRAADDGRLDPALLY